MYLREGGNNRAKEEKDVWSEGFECRGGESEKEEKQSSVDSQNKEQTAAARSQLRTNNESITVSRDPQYIFHLLLWIKSYIKDRHSSAGW